MSRLAKAALVAIRRGLTTASVAACVLAVAVVLAGCSGTPAETPLTRVSKTSVPFVLVTTPAVRDLGLGAALITEFRRTYPNYDIETTVVASGDPASWARAKGGDVVIMGQSASGSKLVADGFASKALPVMSDKLVLVGPKEDPASAKSAVGVAAALRRIADAATSLSHPGGVPVRFVGVSGDRGVAALWAAAGRKPAGEWYSSDASGVAAELRSAVKTQAYAVVDSAAFRAVGGTGLAVLRIGGDMPTQRYVVMPLAGANDPAVSETFGQWLANGAGQDVIARWGVTGAGGPLFTPANASASLWPSQ